MRQQFQLLWIFRELSVVFLCASVGLVVAMACTPPPASSPHSRFFDMLLIAAFWSFSVGGTLWWALFCRRTALIVEDDRVEAVGIIRRKMMILGEVREALWRTRPPGGSLVLKSDSGRIVINFPEFCADGRRAGEFLVPYFRSGIAPERQIGWERFAEVVGTYKPWPPEPKPGPGQMWMTRRRWNRLIVAMMALAVPAGFSAWWLTGEVYRLFGAILGPAFLLFFFRAAIPPFGDGVIATQLTTMIKDPETGRLKPFPILWGAACAAAIVLLWVFRERMDHPYRAMVVFGVVGTAKLAFDAACESNARLRRAYEAARKHGEGLASASCGSRS